MDTLYATVSSRTDATIDGIAIPADLTNSSEAHQQVRRWLWAVLLATGARALAVAGRWADARARLRECRYTAAAVVVRADQTVHLKIGDNQT